MSATHTGVTVDDSVDQDCPIREVLDRVGDKWSSLIVVRLGQRTHRFNELHREISGISQRMLTLTLRSLVRDGLVSRTVYPTVPPRVDYELTDLGRTLLPPISALHEWAVAHRDDIRDARARHDHSADDLMRVRDPESGFPESVDIPVTRRTSDARLPEASVIK